MTTAFDRTFVPLAKNLIRQFGVSSEIRRKSGEYNVTTGLTDASYTAHPVIVTPPARQTQRISNDSASSMGCYVAGSGLAIVPDPSNDVLIFGGSSWQILNVVELRSGDAVAAYLLEVRNGD